MKFKLSLLVASFIPTLSFAAGALMQLEVPAIAQPVISERSNTDILGPKFNSLTVDESATAEYRATIGGNMGDDNHGTRPKIGGALVKEGVGEHAFDSGRLTSRGGNQASQEAPKEDVADAAQPTYN
jgi:hypothetical protein